jgi:hypothetical protein
MMSDAICIVLTASESEQADEFEDSATAEEETHPPATSAEGLKDIREGVETEADAEEDSSSERRLIAIA